MLDQVTERQAEFDVLHFHIDFFHYPLFRAMANRTLTALHGRLDLPDLQPIYRAYAQMPVVSISNSQHTPIPWATWMSTVYHGLPSDLFTQNEKPGEYLAFLGRITPEKGPEEAIAIANAAGIPLNVAAKADPADREYYETVLAPLIATSPLVEYIGEINDHEKQEFLGNARAAVSNQLAGAVRACDDRSLCLRHTRRRLRPRLGKGNRAGGRERRDRERRRKSSGHSRERHGASAQRDSNLLRKALQRMRDGAELCGDLRAAEGGARRCCQEGRLNT